MAEDTSPDTPLDSGSLSRRLSTAVSDEADKKKPFRFLELPAELRLTVYDQILSPGRVFIDWVTERERDELRTRLKAERPPQRPGKAQAQLFMVSPSILEEAKKQFYLNNTFTMRSLEEEEVFRLMQAFPKEPKGLTWSSIKRLSIAFDRRLINLDCHFSVQMHDRDTTAISGIAWLQSIHDRLKERLLDEEWPQIVGGVHGLQLQYLEVNLQNCFCPCGCERLVEDAVENLCSWPIIACPEEIRFLGTRTAEERKICSSIVSSAERKGNAGAKVTFAAILVSNRWGGGGVDNTTWSGVDELHVDAELTEQMNEVEKAT